MKKRGSIITMVLLMSCFMFSQQGGQYNIFVNGKYLTINDDETLSLQNGLSGDEKLRKQTFELKQGTLSEYVISAENYDPTMLLSVDYSSGDRKLELKRADLGGGFYFNFRRIYDGTYSFTHRPPKHFNQPRELMSFDIPGAIRPVKISLNKISDGPTLKKYVRFTIDELELDGIHDEDCGKLSGSLKIFLDKKGLTGANYPYTALYNSTDFNFINSQRYPNIVSGNTIIHFGTPPWNVDLSKKRYWHNAVDFKVTYDSIENLDMVIRAESTIKGCHKQNDLASFECNEDYSSFWFLPQRGANYGNDYDFRPNSALYFEMRSARHVIRGKLHVSVLEDL